MAGYVSSDAHSPNTVIGSGFPPVVGLVARRWSKAPWPQVCYKLTATYVLNQTSGSVGFYCFVVQVLSRSAGMWKCGHLGKWGRGCVCGRGGACIGARQRQHHGSITGASREHHGSIKVKPNSKKEMHDFVKEGVTHDSLFYRIMHFLL